MIVVAAARAPPIYHYYHFYAVCCARDIYVVRTCVCDVRVYHQVIYPTETTIIITITMIGLRRRFGDDNDKIVVITTSKIFGLFEPLLDEWTPKNKNNNVQKHRWSKYFKNVRGKCFAKLHVLNRWHTRSCGGSLYFFVITFTFIDWAQ